MPVLMSSSVTSPLFLGAAEVEEAFLAACKRNAIPDIETRATMSQDICHWYRLSDDTRSRIIHAIRDSFPMH